MIRLLGFLILLSFSLQAAEVKILRVRPYNRVYDVTKITVLDLVDKENLDLKQQQQLAKLTLGGAPKMGEQRVYSNDVVASALRKNFNSKEWSVQIPYQVVVQNRGYELDTDAVKAELLMRWQALCQNCKLRIKSMKLPMLPPALKDRPWSLDASDRLPRGHFSQKISVSVQGQPDQYFWINGEIEVQKKVPVLNRSTPINTRLNAEDINWEWRDVTMATDSNPVENEILGRQARFTMNANDIVWSGSLVREKAVQRGEIVRITIGDEQWQISTQAMTQQDGYVGDTINLKNLQTQKIITGRVVGSGEVIVK